jgi:hypothetical protein
MFRIQKRVNPNGKPRYVVHCSVCRRLGRQWSSRSSLKRAFGKHDGPQRNSWADVMNVWSIHMAVHHPEMTPPDWQVIGGADPRVEAAELHYFDQ